MNWSEDMFPALILTLATCSGPDPTLTNLERAVPIGFLGIWQVGAWTVFVEASTGELEAFHARTVTHLSTGLPVSVGSVVGIPAYYSVSAHDSLVLFEVDEAALGQDLSGDGDTDDGVLHVLDLRDGRVACLGLLGPMLGWFDFQHFMGDGRIAFVVGESAADLNGDGDSQDEVVHVFDAATGQVENLGLALYPFSLTFFPTVDGEYVVVPVNEQAQGATDLNGDGDTQDNVVFLHHVPTGRTLNLGLAGRGLPSRGAHGLFLVDEAEQGVDLTGDGYLTYQALFAFDDDGTPAQLDVAFDWSNYTPFPYSSDAHVWLTVVESRIGTGTDINGDGDLEDQFPFAWDRDSRRLRRLGEQVSGIWSVSGRSGQSVVTFADRESFDGIDRNGDGDALDALMTFWSRGTGFVSAPWAFELGNFAFVFGFADEDVAAFPVAEVEQGADLDGDGALGSTVHVVHDFTASRSTVVPWPVEQVDVHAGYALFLRDEAQEGLDWTGDGAADDFALFAVEARTGLVTNFGVPVLVEQGSGIRAHDDGLVPLRVPEDGTDLNGDGDTTDFVLHLLEL